MRIKVLGLLLTVAVLAGCAARIEPGQPDDTIGAPRPVADTGCGAPPPGRPGETVLEDVVSDGVAREYAVHIPISYDVDAPTPVVMAFHGHGGNPQHHEKLTEFSQFDALAVYPQGLLGTDGKSAWQGAPYSADTDDVRFTAEMLDQLERTFCVDTRRIYASGKSNGAGFAELLACRLSERIAAIAPVAGIYYPERGPCSPVEPVPMVTFHGTADRVMPYHGDPSRGLPALPHWHREWAGYHGCVANPVSEPLTPRLTLQVWRGCDGRADRMHYRIIGLDHIWPSTEPNEDSSTPTVVDASKVAWQFFMAHPRRA